jgi:hypothetical protein
LNLTVKSNKKQHEKSKSYSIISSFFGLSQ